MTLPELVCCSMTSSICFPCRCSPPRWSHLCVFSGMSVQCKYMGQKLNKSGTNKCLTFNNCFLGLPMWATGQTKAVECCTPAPMARPAFATTPPTLLSSWITWRLGYVIKIIDCILMFYRNVHISARRPLYLWLLNETQFTKHY